MLDGGEDPLYVARYRNGFSGADYLPGGMDRETYTECEHRTARFGSAKLAG